MNLLSSLPFTIEDVIMVINIVFLAILLLCVLIGFCRGTKKSVFYMISTLIFLVGGFFLSDVICNALLNIDLSSYGLSIPIEEDKVYPIDGTLNDLLIVILDDMMFGGKAADTATLTLIIGVVQLAFRIVWFLLLIILSFTIFKWISDIVWLFFRPKKQVVPGKKRKRRPKPKIGSRLGGAGIGMCKGLLYGLLFFFIFAGVISIVETYSEVTSNNEEVSYNMVITPNTATLVKLNSEGEKPLDEYQEIIDMLLAYKKSAPGIIYGTIEIKGTSIDEFMFDELLKIKVDGLDTNLKLRQEIKKIAEAFAECPELLSQGFSTEMLIEMTKDPEQNAKLKTALAKITDLKIINIAIPVTLELVLLSDMVVGSIEDEDLKEQIANLDIEALKQIDYGAEFKNLGYAFVDIMSLLDDEQQVDFLNMNTQTIDAIFDSIGQLELIDIFAPIAINYVMTSGDVQAMFTELGIDSSELGLGDIEDWSGEVEILGDILTAFLEIGLTNEDIEDFTQIDINEEFCEKIDNFTEVLFTSNIIKNAIPVVGNFAINQLPEEYAEIVSIPSDADSEFWQGELKPLLKAALALLSTGILTPEEGMEPQDVIAEMSDDQITELASYLSQSSILTNSLNNIINKLVSAKVDEDGNVIEEGMLGDIVLVGFESADEWNETEIFSIFKALVTILKSGIIGSEDYVNSLSTLTDCTINDLASSLSGSKFIRNNLSAIISYLLQSMNEGGNELEIVVLEADEWDKEELSNIFLLFREIASSGLLNSESDNVFAELTDESIDNIAKYMSGSKFITMNLTPIMDMLLSSVDLGGIEIKGFEDYRDWTQLEISSLFKSAKIIINYTDDLTQLIKLSEDELDVLTSSTIVSNVLVDFITEYSKEGGELELIEGTELVAEDGWVDAREDVEFTYSSGVITVTSDAEIDTDKYYVYVLNEDGNYEKVTSSSNGVIDLNNYVSSAARRRIQTLPQANEIKVIALEFGEIRSMFLAVQAICKDNEISTDSIMDALSSVTEDDMYKILDSIVISETLIYQIEEIASETDALVCIPEGDLKAMNPDGIKDRTAWYEQEDGTHGELFNALKAMSILFNGENFSNLTFDTDMFTSIEDDDISIVLKSRIINETLIVKIDEMTDEASGAIYIPNELITEDEIDRVKWNANSESVNLLKSLKKLFSGSSIDVNNISIYNLIENEEEVLKSLVVTETIKRNILDIEVIKVPTDLSVDTLDEWKNVYVNDSISQRGELSYLLRGIKVALTVDENTTLETIQSEEISLTSIVDDRDEILISKVLSETIKDKIITTEGISLPQNYTDPTDKYNYINWYNTYNGEVLETRGEIDALLASADLMFGGGEINFDNISLYNVIENRNEVLKSIIISETIKDKVAEMNEIKVPSTLDVNTLEGWSNTYSNGTVSVYGELNYLLRAIKYALNVDQSTTLDSIQDKEISLTDIVDERSKILKSLVLTETIKVKIIATDGISLPENYTDSSKPYDFIVWENKYEANDEVPSSRGEIDALLASADLMFGGGDINFDNIPLNTIIVNRDEVLKSLIISETIKDKIVEMEEIKVPSTLDVNTLEGWRNTYENSEIAYGELNYLLKAIKIALNVDENTKLNAIQSNELGLSSIIDDRDIVLRSLVFTETLKFKIVDNDNLNKPSEWDKEANVNNFIVWENEYEVSDEVPSSRGEIDALLAACKHMFGDNEINFDNLGQFEYSILFDDAEIRKTILTSKIVSEIMIVKIEDMISADSMHIPGEERVPGLHNVNNRTLWWNLEYGELIHFIEGSSHLLTDEEKENLEGLKFGVDKVYNHMINEEEREIIVKSYILSETLSDNFKELDLYTQHEAHVDEIGVELGNNFEWYGIEIVENQRKIQKKELWHLISSIKVILGDAYTSEKAFELDDIFGTDADHRSPLAPTEEEVLGKHYFSFDWANMDIFLESLLMQTVFEDVLFETIDSGALSGKIVAPIYGYEVSGTNYLRFEYTYNKYKNENLELFNDDEFSNLVEYDTKRMIEAIIIMNIAGLNYDELSHFEGSISDIAQAMTLIKTLENIRWDILVDAFFISRAFRGSIESILNPVFATLYQFAYTYAMLNGSPIPAWDTVKLQNADYAYPLTKEQGAELLLNDIKVILENINSVR